MPIWSQSVYNWSLSDQALYQIIKSSFKKMFSYDATQAYTVYIILYRYQMLNGSIMIIQNPFHLMATSSLDYFITHTYKILTPHFLTCLLIICLSWLLLSLNGSEFLLIDPSNEGLGLPSPNFKSSPETEMFTLYQKGDFSHAIGGFSVITRFFCFTCPIY